MVLVQGEKKAQIKLKISKKKALRMVEIRKIEQINSKGML